MQDSGNCYKVRLALAQLSQSCELVDVNILEGESRTESFLARNPNGRVPVLELDDGTMLPESNAILAWLADGPPLLPVDRLLRAQVLQWMFFEQYSHEPYIATVRYWRHILNDAVGYTRQIEEREPYGYAALQVMERHLADRAWFVGDGYSIADIALYAYTHVAEEGYFSLAAYPAVRGSLARVASVAGHVEMATRQW